MKWVALGALVGVAAVALWIRLAGTRPQDVSDEAVDDLPYSDPYLNELWLLTQGRHRSEGGALIKPQFAAQLLRDELAWRQGNTPFQRFVASFRAKN